ncbi:Protease Do-like 7 [Linum perenne]
MPELDTSLKDELCMDIDPPFRDNAATAEDWRKSLEKVVPAVVVLRTTACRAFDTESAGASYATGFVVDKRLGIILTNRHVVKPGPVVAEAMFLNREEIPVYPIYRDPVHDFGFFRYDPGAIQFLKYEEIPLAPEAASVGLEIRVVGNDSGEKVSILAGTLARLDRDAPHYKKDGYNDFNTFYMQAASGTKGGSSGSPVIDWQGRAVALNAGSKSSSASAFFLPLERVTFVHKGFDETRRLGLKSETEQIVRVASPLGETGMLVVDSAVPGGPAHTQLEPGDMLVRVNGEVMTQFLKLETLLDDSVGKVIELQIERGGTSFTVNLVVQDLHSITPNYFLEVSGAVIHPLSYQQARNFRFHCGLVYVADPGYMLFRAGIPRHAIIKKFAGEEISQIDDLIVVLSKLSRGGRVPLEYISYTDRHRRKSVLVTVDRHEWYAPPQIYTRNDSSGLWTAKPAIQPESLRPVAGVNNTIHPLASETVILSAETANLKKINQRENLDSANGDIGMETCNELSGNQSDIGIKKRRLSDLSGNEISVGDGSFCEPEQLNMEDSESNGNEVLSDNQGVSAVANASFAESVIEPTLVMFEMEYASFSRLLCTVVVYVGAEPPLRRGESVYLVGLSRSLQATSRKSIVTNPCAALNIGSADSPRYRATNMEVIELDTDFGSTFSGVLTNEHGKVQAIWASFSTQLKFGGSSSEDHQFVRGIPSYAVSEVLDKIISGANGPSLLINGIRRPMPHVRILEVELYPTLLSKARSFGLSNNWVQALVKKDPIRRQVLRVKGCLAGSNAENILEQGDMVLAVDKEPVTCFRDIEKACQDLDKIEDTDGTLKITVFRQGREIDLLVGTDVRDGNGTTRAINWCGCIVQDPHPAVRALGFLPEEGHGVYVARWCHGSPAHRYGLYALQWIVEVNGKPTPNIDAFVNVAKELGHGEFVRVKTVHLNGKPRVMTLKQDLHYWPTWELRFDPDTSMWRRQTIKALNCHSSPDRSTSSEMLSPAAN